MCTVCKMTDMNGCNTQSSTNTPPKITNNANFVRGIVDGSTNNACIRIRKRPRTERLQLHAHCSFAISQVQRTQDVAQLWCRCQEV